MQAARFPSKWRVSVRLHNLLMGPFARARENETHCLERTGSFILRPRCTLCTPSIGKRALASNLDAISLAGIIKFYCIYSK